MTSQLITADRIHDGTRFLPDGTVVELSDDGTVIALHQDPLFLQQAVFYEGTLLPAFVNVHCHLELSHLENRVPRHTGLIPFLQQVTLFRNEFTEEAKRAARHRAYRTLHDNGVIAVGDIANGTDTLDLREQQLLHMHTFVECIGFTETHAPQRLAYSKGVLDAFAQQTGGMMALSQSIVPHAPYSVSASLFRLIADASDGSPLSIHNQESPEEDRFYRDKTGAVHVLLAGLGIDSGFFMPSGKSSLQTYLTHFPADQPMIFVHNTCTAAEDIRFARQYLDNCWWCLCPNANLYIENRLPDVPMLLASGAEICIGTDSLASNSGLSVLAELQTLAQYFPETGWETLLRWGTRNGAEALGLGELVGSLRPGLRPGIICLSGDRVSWVHSGR